MSMHLGSEWTFESSITTPTGVRVNTTIYVPERVAWTDVLECAEIAQMCANRAVAHIKTSSEHAGGIPL